MVNYLNKKQKGFTLIELLVVISIIGLLSSIVLASLSTARQRASIAVLQQEGSSVANALEAYYNDFGRYPVGVYGTPLYYSFQDQLQTSLSNYISKVAPTASNGIQGITLYKWSSTRAVVYVNTKDYGTYPYYCGNTKTYSQPYILYFLVLTSQKDSFSGKFPEFRAHSTDVQATYTSGGNIYSYFCLNYPPN